MSLTLGRGTVGRTFAAAGGGGPVVTGAPTNDLGDTLGGGARVVIPVDDSTGATGVTLGGVAMTSFAIDDATHVSGVPGAHAAGVVDIVVTNAGGTSTGGGGLYEYWDFDVIGATRVLERPDYASGTWTARTGGVNATEATTPPAATSGVPDFNGTNDLLACATPVIRLLTGEAAGTMGVYFRAETIAASAGAVYDDPALVADTGGNFGLHIGQTNKVRAYVYDGAPKVVDATIAPATDYLAIMRWDSTNLEMILNGTAQTPTAAGALTGFLEGTMRLGVNYASAAYFNGKQSLVFTLPSKISDANAAKARKYVISKGWTTPTTPLLDVDFSALSLGGLSASSFLSSTGLTFTRTSVSTVQTSASAVDSTPGVNYACIGDRATGSRGLVIQHNTRNLYSTSGQARDWTSGWTGGSGCTVSASTGVDGTANTGQLVITSGGFGPYLNSPASQRFTFSSWLRSVVADPQQFAWNNGSTAANADVVNAAGTTTWQRLKIAKGTTTRQYSTVCDCRDYSAVGGTTAQARSVIADYAQYEAGDFVTEAIPTGTGYRTVDMLSYATGSSLVASTGEVRFYAKMIPKFSSTMGVNYDGTAANGVSAAWYLFSWGANGQNYAKINDSDKKLYVRIANGAAVTSTNAIAFSAFDVLEVDVRVGNNVSSVARYRLNAGAWVDLVLATVIDVPNPGANPIRVLSNDNATANGDSGAFPCWLQRVTFHSDAGSPS